ncbi:hypothetical protein VPHD479_0019 [Vibrio phage D479]
MNQDMISRLNVGTISDAVAANFRIGEFVSIAETGLTYQCKATSGDITLSNGLFLLASDHVLRGGSSYEVYTSGKAYSVGDKVFNTTTNLYYRCIADASTSDPFSAAFFQEMSLEQGYEIADEATQYARAKDAEFGQTLQVMQTRDSLTNGDLLTTRQCAIIASTLGLGAYFRTTNGRVLPRFGNNATNNYGIYGGDLADPTTDGAAVELVIPRVHLHKFMRLNLHKIQSSTGGVKNTWLYSGDPLTGGTEVLPEAGVRSSSDTSRQVTYLIDDISNDLHLVIRNEWVQDINVMGYIAETPDKTRMAIAMGEIVGISGYVNGDQFTSWDADAILRPLGVAAYFRKDQGRVLPSYYNQWGLGFTAPEHADPTTAGPAVEIVVPKAILDPNNEITILRSASTGTGSRYVRVFSGDPISGGTEITPHYGTAIQLTTDSAVASFRVGSGNINLPEDIHIVISLQYVKDISVGNYRVQDTFDTTPIDAIRGSGAYADYQETGTAYTTGDKVFDSASRLNYRALVDIADPAGAFDPTDWRELSIESLDEASPTTQIDALRGDAQYPQYQPTGTAYSIGDKVFEPVTGRNYRANQLIIPPAGAFNASEWTELSVRAMDEGLTVGFARIETQIDALRGDTEYDEYDVNSSYTVDDKVRYNNKNFICIVNTPVPTGAFDPNDWKELSIESIHTEIDDNVLQINAVRGAGVYETYAETGTAYSIGDKVFEPTLNKNYKAKVAIADPAGAFTPASWEELSVEFNAEPTTIRDRLSELSGDDRLDASAIKNIVSPSSGGSGLHREMLRVAARDSITNGDLFTEAQINEVFSGLPFETTVVTSGANYAMPNYFNDANVIGFYTNNGYADPTFGGANGLVLKIDKEYFDSSKELAISSVAWGTTNERWIRAYNGDATASGTELELSVGLSQYYDTSTPMTRKWAIPDGCDDIYIYIGQQVVFDIQLTDVTTTSRPILGNNSVSAVVRGLVEQYDYAHTSQLAVGDAELVAGSISAGAYFRTTNGRLIPVVFNSGGRTGFWLAGASLDPTGDVAIPEIVIPASSLQHNMTIKMVNTNVTSVAGQSVQVYSGNPTGSGVRLTPIAGTETDVGYTEWNVSSTPTATGVVADDLHLCFISKCIHDIELINHSLDVLRTSHGEGFENVHEELRGGTVPSEFSSTSSYSAGDRVYRATDNRVYAAKVAITAGAWNASQWNESSINENESRITVAESTVANHETEIDALRGANAYGIYDQTANYVIGDRVYYSGRDYEAIAPSTAQAFTPANWYQLSVRNNASPYAVRDRLQRLTGDDRLDVSAVKGLVAVDREVSQTAHGFALLQPVVYNGTQWIVADNSSADTTAQAVVTEIVDVNTFRAQVSGIAEIPSHGLTVGDYYWLGASGSLDITQPTTGIIQEVLRVFDTDLIHINLGQAFQVA